MTENAELEIVENTNLKTKILVLVAIVGALTGIGAAYLLLQRADDEGLELTPGEGVKLGISVFTLFRQIVNLGN
jgi:glucokinase